MAVSRALRFTLLGLAIVLFVGCGGKPAKPQTLEQWASSVCTTFNSYGRPGAINGVRKLYDLNFTALGVSGPDDPRPRKPRKDIAELIPEDLLLMAIANMQEASQSTIEKLEALEPPPDTKAGRLAGRLLRHDGIEYVRDTSEYVREQENAVRETYAHEPTPREILTALSLVLNAMTVALLASESMARQVGFGGLDAVDLQVADEVAEAFKAADGCQAWRPSIEHSEEQRERLRKP